jgi:riboflavin kinase/FMN adenylyltransferase
MIRINGNQSLPAFESSVVSVGNFDGVHSGHQTLVSALVKRAIERKATSIVITFEPHPKEVLHPKSPLHLLTTCNEKELLLKDCGVDIMACLEFNREIASMAPSDFVEDVLVKRFGAVEWVMGENHTFGSGRQGTKEFLREYPGRKHINTFAVPLNSLQSAVISSTRIRSRIVEGKIREAVGMLGHPYLVAAKRKKGVQTGTVLGFPTLNFELPPSKKVIPPPGVYAAELTHGSDRWTGALYIGNCPTFSGRDYHLEFHALSGDMNYPEDGVTAALWIHQFVRKDEFFSSQSELIDKIRQDINQIQDFFNKE